MKHIIGKATFFCLLSTIFLGASGISITMEIADAHGKAIDQVMVGVPFQLRVIVKGQNTTGNMPNIEHPQDFVCRRSGIQMHSINGLTTTVYVYNALASTPKKYTIGPATIVLNGSPTQASPITFDAIKSSQNNSANNTSSAPVGALSSKPFMECVLKKPEAFVGEIVPCTLRFYCPSHIQRVTLKQIKGPQLNEIQLTQRGGQKEGLELVNKKPFKYIEWEFDMQFLKDGAIEIPSFGAEYTIDEEDDGMLFGGFSVFFQHNTLRQVQSNTSSIIVKPIPDYKGQPVTAVGLFTNFSATIAPATIAVGEAATFSLRLTGVGNVSMIPHPSLTGILPTVKIYESQSKIEHNSYNAEKTKLFEYIIQAVEPGLIKIPEQNFVFFNPEQKKHVEISTESVELYIKPTEGRAPITVVNDQTGLENGNIQTVHKMLDDPTEQVSLMDPIEAVGSPTYKLPLSYRHLLLFIIFLMLFICMYYFIIVTIRFVYDIITYKFAYFIARKAVKKLEKINNSAQLITVFKRYVSSRRSAAQVYEDDLFLAVVVGVLGDQQLVADWKLFHAILMEAAYGSASELYDNHAIWRQSYHWLYLLKKKGI
ncbi:MAG TPA: BatD family protein [Patescibacteria group bacterium]|jgi:hypothetical protein|nr:BatD family protein [Patescibacteria group bacterium]